MNNFSIDYLTGKLDSRETIATREFIADQKQRILDCSFEKMLSEVSYRRTDSCSLSPPTLSSSIPSSTASSASLPNSSSSPSSISSSPGLLSPSESPSASPSFPKSRSPSSSLSVSPTTSSEKPAHSYIALISMSILNSPEKKVLLGDIYQYIMDNFPYYNNKEKAWRNSIRHNLSLNECFIKSGRADNGKGNYWSIHPACIEDFSRGDFRRRQARRRARKNTMSEMNVSELPMNQRFNLGYVPMTTSTLPFSGVPVNYPQFPITSNQMTPGLGYPPFLAAPSRVTDLTSSPMAAATLSYSPNVNFYQHYLPNIEFKSC
ncbi:hypothetical protein SNE40_005058 [Patella caerulea]|uniref:Fork-head domain-containing protein n=1 Tax=Patella caerulea TaxID=87958 RepID=A0AAN8K4C6_PATCE